MLIARLANRVSRVGTNSPPGTRQAVGRNNMVPPKLSERLKTSLDELRMQMLGAQVLLGFRSQARFQGLVRGPREAQRLASAVGFVAILLTIVLTFFTGRPAKVKSAA